MDGRSHEGPVPGDVTRTESRLWGLVEAHRSVMESLDIEVILRRALTAASSISGARDGAIVLFDDQGLPARVLRSDGSSGSALAVALAGGKTAPLTRVERDSTSAGVDRSVLDGGFLGVPVRSHGDAYGALYLVGRSTEPFTEEDEELVVALAATAGIALENARLHEVLRRRLRWSAALTDVSSALLSEDASDAIGVAVSRVGTVVDTHVIGVVIPDPDSDQLIISTARGVNAERFEGRRYPRHGSLVDRALRSGNVVLAPAGEASKSLEAEMGPNMVLPVIVAGEAICALTLTRSSGSLPFTSADVDMAAEFARHVGLAIELTRARGDRRRAELADERARIARDLHDHVIQRLFAAGLTLQALAARYPEAATALADEADNIDTAIGEIRTAVFALAPRGREPGGTIRHRILDVVSQMSDALRASPHLTFSGPVDLMLTGELADDVLAVVRECLANIARHASADVISVNVTVDGDRVQVSVDDDGVGASGSPRRSGVRNLAERAKGRGGDFTLSSKAGGGTRAIWCAGLRTEGSRE